MTDVSKIAWGAYSSYEGPIYSPRQGAIPYRPPSNPSLTDKILITLAATEGGSPSSINMYDLCKFTPGLGQACEGSQFWASWLFGSIYRRQASLLAPLAELGVTMGQSGTGRWLFRSDHSGLVDTAAEQQQTFFGATGDGHNTGKKGAWNDAGRAHAKQFCAAAATVLEQPAAVTAQIDWWGPRLRGFAAGELAKHLRLAEDQHGGNPIAEAFICGALSFAANNPLRARLAFEHALRLRPFELTEDWLAHCLRWLTKGPPEKPAPAIYPHRYAAIRPVLERLFTIDLPDNAAELEGGMPTSEIQWILVHVCGHDLGSSGPDGDGVDNKWGPKSSAALLDFERRNGVTGPELDGLPDPHTCDLLRRDRDDWRAEPGVSPTPEPAEPLSLILARATEQMLDDIGIFRSESLRQDHQIEEP